MMLKIHEIYVFLTIFKIQVCPMWLVFNYAPDNYFFKLIVNNIFLPLTNGKLKRLGILQNHGGRRVFS